MENTRELAIEMLLEITEKGTYSHLIIRDVLDKYNYSDTRDKAFVKRLTEGTLERLIQIDFILNYFSKIPASKMKPFIRSLLRVSVYQLMFMDTVPDSAVCNEAVKLAGKRGFRNLQGFVNGVLRNIARNRSSIAYPDKETETINYFSVKYSMPQWLVLKWINEYGADTAEKIMEGLLAIHPVTLRVKETIPDNRKEEWIKALTDKKVQIRQNSYITYAYEVNDTDGIRNLPGYDEGIFNVQDVTSMLAVEAADIKEGNFIIDVCSSPGGKALYAAEKLKGTGSVLARDLTEYKVSLIRDNIERMGYSNIQAQIWDAAVPDEERFQAADIVLADLPCSGLGIIGKKRDIKYKVTPESIEELINLQKTILQTVWQYVKPGGVLIYSTCTINKEENQEVAQWFLENFPFEAERFDGSFPEELKKEAKQGMLQLLPGIHAGDGFFIARMKRKAE